MNQQERLTDLLKQADEHSASRCITDYNEATADNAAFLLENGVIVLTDDLIFILTAIAWGCSSNEALSPCATYRVNNDLLGNREILISEALYRFDKLLCEIADRRADDEPRKSD
jgi:hypothetical protein